MPYRFNPFTCNLDFYKAGSGSGVSRVGNTNDRRITIWSGNNSDTIQNSNAEVQVGGAVQAQGFVGRKEIDAAVLIPSKHYMISSGVTIMTGGSITIESDSEMIII